jgi:hypothetical protein
MSDEDLNDEELDSLINDLEGRSEDGGSSSADLEDEMPEDEELQALLEGDESASSSNPASTATKVAGPEQEAGEVGPDLSDLDLDDELPVEGEPTESTAPEPEAEPKPDAQPSEQTTTPQADPSEAASEPSNDTAEESGRPGLLKALPYVTLAGKWSAYALPILALWWVLGAYLAQWITAGWLIAVVATLFVVAVPKAAYDAADRRGKFRWWIAGGSLILTAALVAPMPESAGAVLTHYGHWPASIVVEVTGGDGGMLVDASSAAGEWLGRVLYPDVPADAGMRSLGN